MPGRGRIYGPQRSFRQELSLSGCGLHGHRGKDRDGWSTPPSLHNSERMGDAKANLGRCRHRQDIEEPTDGAWSRFPGGCPADRRQPSAAFEVRARAEQVDVRILSKTSSLLGVPLSLLFGGAGLLGGPDSEGSKEVLALRAFVSTEEGQELNHAFHRIGEGKIRRLYLALVRAVAGI